MLLSLTALLYYFVPSAQLPTLLSSGSSSPSQRPIPGTDSDQPNCHPSLISHPSLLGIQPSSLTANPITDYTVPSSPFPSSACSPSSATTLTFCNLTFAYTHPSVIPNRDITLTLWLPSPSAWNNRYLATGGGGFAPGLGSIALSAPVSEGYAAISTDGGFETFDSPGFGPEKWALLSPGNVDLNALYDFGVGSLVEMSLLGEQLTTSYYGRQPKRKYWNGCSTGGRQGLMLAQRLSGFFDGILAAAPAIGWPDMVLAGIWGQMVMRWENIYPAVCELEAITMAAVEDCDWKDGVRDGVVSEPEKCAFEAEVVVGNVVECATHPEGKTKITKGAARVARAMWDGPRNPQGERLWWGLPKGTPLTSLVKTECEYTDGGEAKCVGAPLNIADDYVKLFLFKQPKDLVNLSAVTHQQYADLFQQSRQEYESFLGSRDPDLSAFARDGGKMITWHGLADQLIFPNGSRNYYESVLKHFEQHDVRYHSTKSLQREEDAQKSLKDVTDFYRYYEAPSVAHCMGGSGPYPGSMIDVGGAFEQLVSWVEEGVRPDVLDAMSDDREGGRLTRPICMWPKVAKYSGKGDWRHAANWGCEHKT